MAMTKEKLAEIRERLGKITHGPWKGHWKGNTVKSHCVWSVADQKNVCSSISPKTGNADFIANSPADIQFLLDFIDGQQRQLEDRLEDQTDACLMCDKLDMVVLESENEGLKQQLQQIKESNLRPADKYLKNLPNEQFRHMDSELREIEDADDVDHVIEEVVDLQMSCETMLAVLGLNEKQRREARLKVIEKNEKRGYYNQ